MSKRQQFVGASIFLVVAIFCTSFIALILSWAIREHQSARWTRTTARIISAEPGLDDLAFAYHVGGDDYEGDTVLASSRPARWLRRPHRWYDKWQRGAVVDAYYDPTNPSRSCLLPGRQTPWSDALALAIAGVAGLASVCGFVFHLRQVSRCRAVKVSKGRVRSPLATSPPRHLETSTP